MISDGVERTADSVAGVRPSMRISERPLRLCVLTDSFYPVVGGGEVHARLLASELSELGIGVHVVTRRRLAGTQAYESMEGFDVHRVPPEGHPRFGKYLMFPAAIAKLVTLRNQYDAIYVCGLRTLGVLGVLVGSLLKKPCVLRSESCTELSGEYALDSITEAGSSWNKKVFLTPIRALIALRNVILLRADHFVAISTAVLQEYIECGVAPTQITSIRNGIDVRRFSPASTAEKQAKRKDLCIPDGRVFVYTGKLNRGKGLELLLRVWRAFAPAYPDAHLLMVGAGANQFLSCERQLRDFVQNEQLQDRVSFTGNVSDVRDYLWAADYLVLPSESEALGLSLIEAMSCGLPTIATRVGGIPDVIDDGTTGILIPVGDEASLQRAMIRFMEDTALTQRLSSAARNTVLERFDIRPVAREHVRLFDMLLARVG